MHANQTQTLKDQENKTLNLTGNVSVYTKFSFTG